MRRWLIPTILLVALISPAPGQAAEITDVLDAADGKDPIDVNIDIHFRSILDRSKITHEDASYWSQPDYLHRPDFNELRYQQQVYAMDYMVQIGLYHDVELYINLPWIISDKKKINFVSGVSNSTSTMFRANPGATWAGNLVAADPTTSPETKRSGIGDMQVGVKWAIFNEERDDTKSVWLFGLDYQIPSGKLNRPQDIVGGGTGGVGLGHHILTPFMLFSHRYKILDPYVGIHGSLPIQGREAQNAGLTLPYYGGFLVGMEIVPWENKDKFQKFSIDLKLTTDFYGEVDVKGDPKKRGTVNEMSDFLVCHACDTNSIGAENFRQYQAQSNYTKFGLDLGFIVRAAEFVRFRFGVSLAHRTEHFLSGADACQDLAGGAGGGPNGDCGDAGDIENRYDDPLYDDPGKRVRVEETTLFTWWVTGMVTF